MKELTKIIQEATSAKVFPVVIVICCTIVIFRVNKSGNQSEPTSS
jgi:hypothetical protein